MPDLEGSQTHANLAAAFGRESQARSRYLWFAQAADVDGRPDLADMFRTIADARTGQVNGLLEHLADSGDPLTGEPIGDTDDNLRAAVVGETHGASERYPAFAATARAEGFESVAEWFEALGRAERRYAEQLRSGPDPVG